MKVVSLFAGIGGFDLAFRSLGHEIVYANEWDKYASQVYERNFLHKPDTRDITKVDASEIPDHDLLTAGFPCQAFSIAGKRRGFDDTRGTLFFDVARILSEKRPTYILLENVKGLLNHDGGRTFSTILGVLADLGYGVEWQVLNSKHFGVPQNRERVFIVGHLRGTSRPQVFPFGGTDEETDKTKKFPEPISNCLRTNYSNGKSNETYIRQLNQPKHSNDRVYGTDGVSPTLNTMQGGRRQPFITDPQGRKNKVCNPQPYANTLRANTHGNEQIVNNIRRLTPVECERLQGFPDGWTEGISDTQRYKCLGNAVTVNVVKAIAHAFDDLV